MDHVDNDDPSLIKQIQSKVLPKRGIWANKDQILITSGSQNAIYMIASLLTKQGTVVGMENPGYPDVRNIFSSKTENVIPINIDQNGIVIEDIKPETDIIFTTPSHQYPTGVTMSMERRNKLLSIAKENQMVIIEDDYEAEINFQKKPHPSLKSLDKDNNVIYVGSFSKAFAPGLRLGYMVAPESFIEEVKALRRLMIRHIPANNQRSVALFIGLVQLFFGITEPKNVVATYAHDAVWFIAGSLAMGATMVKYGLDKRIGMLVMNLSGTKVRNVVLGILVGTAIPSAFISEASIAPMFLPIAMALYTLTSKKIGDATQLGKLLMMSIAIGCMVGAPMSPTGGARNAIMIGFLGNLGPEYEISFMQWMILGSFYTFFLGLFFAFLLPLLYKPEVDDLSDAVNTLRAVSYTHLTLPTKA